MKGVRLIAAALCALLVLAVPVMADDGWELPGVVDQNDTPALEQPAEPSPESPPAPEPAPPAEPPREPTGDSTGSGTEDGAENGAGNTGEPSHELDDGLWGDWSNPSNIPGMEEPSEKQQELEEARRELEEKQQQRDEAFREAERENAALPEEEEKQKKPAGSKAADAAPHRAGAAPAGSENRQPGAVHPHRGAAGRGPLHCHLPVYPPGAGGRPRR